MQPTDGIAVFGERVAGQHYVLRPGAYALIENDAGEFALVRTPQGLFLPGGGIEKGETVEQALVRELLEECALAVRPGARVCEAVQFVHSPREQKHFEKHCVFARVTVERSGAGTPERDHELVWMSASEAADRLSHASQAWAVRCAAQMRAAIDAESRRG